MNRRWTAAGMAVLLASLAAPGCRGAPPPSPPPAPRPAPLIEPPSFVPVHVDISACVVRNGRMEMVTATYNAVTGDTTVNGRLFTEEYPATVEYAAGAPWFVSNDIVVYAGSRYVKYALPRTLGPQDVVPIGRYRGVTVFAEPNANAARPEVFYLPVAPDCLFQPYEGSEVGGAVRG